MDEQKPEGQEEKKVETDGEVGLRMIGVAMRLMDKSRLIDAIGIAGTWLAAEIYDRLEGKGAFEKADKEKQTAHAGLTITRILQKAMDLPPLRERKSESWFE